MMIKRDSVKKVIAENNYDFQGKVFRYSYLERVFVPNVTQFKFLKTPMFVKLHIE